MTTHPQLLILGQVTREDVVPAEPGPWQRQIGGNVLYAAAGARLWLRAEAIGIVCRVGDLRDEGLEAALGEAGLRTDGLRRVDIEHLIEWLIYEPDGSRRFLPRNPTLREAGIDGATQYTRYLAHLESLSPTPDDIPKDWLPALAAHLCPQVLARHRIAAKALGDSVGWLSVDPSPHYTRTLSAGGLRDVLAPAKALLPSEMEVGHLRTGADSWSDVARRLSRLGFPEVLIKLGAQGSILSLPGQDPKEIPAVATTAVDPTGAGDGFCGAYAAARLLGHGPHDAAVRATVAASLIVECRGAMAALRLDPQLAEVRLAAVRPA
jgi:ribokinase